MIRILFALALIFSGPARAAFDASLSTPSVTVSGNTVTAAGQIAIVAIDFSAGKVWWSDTAQSSTGAIVWNGDVSADPATNTGGKTWSPTGTIYAAVSTYIAASGQVCLGLVSTASRLATFTPSGFSALDTATGTTNTWDSGKKSANYTLSNGDMTACQNTTGGQNSVLSTGGVSSGKVVWGVELISGVLSSRTGNVFPGGANSSHNTSEYVGQNTNSEGWYNEMSGVAGGFAYYNASPVGAIMTQLNRADGVFYRTALVNAPKSGSAKVFYEYQVTAPASTADLAGGSAFISTGRVWIGPGSQSGADEGNGFWFNWNTSRAAAGVTANGSNTAASDKPYVNTWNIVVWDSGTKKIWHYDSTAARWNDGTGGTPLTGSSSFTLTNSFTLLSGMTLTNPSAAGEINTAGPFTNTTVISSLVAAGYVCWDAGTCSYPTSPGRPRGLIFGANDNFPPVRIERDRCRWASVVRA